MTEYERHVAYLKDLGERRIARAKARVKRHAESHEKARDAFSRSRAMERLCRADRRVQHEIDELADMIASYTKYFGPAALPS